RPGELGRIRVFVCQAHLPLAESPRHGPGRRARAPAGETGEVLMAEPQSRRVRGGHREGRESRGARPEADVRREVVFGRHAERLAQRGLLSNRVHDGPDPLHVTGADVAVVDRGSVPRDAAELDGRACHQGRGAHADRVMERESEDRVREAVVLDQPLDRMGDRGRLHRSPSRTAGRSPWSRISPSARSVDAPGQKPVLNQTVRMPTAAAPATSAVTSSPMWTTSCGAKPRPWSAARKIRGSGFRRRNSSEYPRNRKWRPIPSSSWSWLRYRPQLRPVFEMSPIARPREARVAIVAARFG